MPGFLDTRWGEGWLCAVDAAEGFPSSPLGWPTGKSAHERSSQVFSEDCALAGTQTLGCMVMFAFLWCLFLGGREVSASFPQLRKYNGASAQPCFCQTTRSLCLFTATFWPYPFSPIACPLRRALLRILLEVLSDIGTCFQAWQAIPHSCGNAGMPLELPLVGRVMLMGTCSGSTWRRAGAGSRAGPFLEAVFITFDSCTTNKHANKPASPSDITRAEQYNYRAQVSSINLTLALWRALKPANA